MGLICNPPVVLFFQLLLAIITILSSHTEKGRTEVLKYPADLAQDFCTHPSDKKLLIKGFVFVSLTRVIWSGSSCWLCNFCQHHRTKGYSSQSHTVYGMSPVYLFTYRMFIFYASRRPVIVFWCFGVCPDSSSQLQQNPWKLHKLNCCSALPQGYHY